MTLLWRTMLISDSLSRWNHTPRGYVEAIQL